MTDAISSWLVIVHGAWRWVVLVSAGVCVTRFMRDLLGHRLCTAADRRWALVFVAALDVQLTLGLLLLVKLHAPASFVGHAAAMIGAVTLAHCGNIAIKRAPADIAPKWAVPFFGCASIIILAAIPWSRPLLRLS